MSGTLKTAQEHPLICTRTGEKWRISLKEIEAMYLKLSWKNRQMNGKLLRSETKGTDQAETVTQIINTNENFNSP